MKKSLLISYAFILLLLASCSSGRKSLEHGNYYQACIKAIDRLRSNPDKEKAQDILVQAYPLALSWYQGNIDELLNSTDPLKWTKTIGSYQSLNRLYHEIRRSPGALRVISSPKSFSSQINIAKQKAGPECYKAGMVALSKNNRFDAKIAYRHFANSHKYVPNYMDVISKMEEATYMATLRVIIEHIPIQSNRYKMSAEFFQSQVTQLIYKEIKRPFVRFYTPEEAEMENLEFADHIVSMKFEDFMIGATNNSVLERQVISVDSVKVGTLKLKNGKSVDVYNRVKANLKIYRRELISNGSLSLQIINYSNSKLLLNKPLGGEYVWFCQWGSFNGDERALSRKEYEICQSDPILPPQKQDLFVEFTKPIFSSLSAELKRFYSRY